MATEPNWRTTCSDTLKIAPFRPDGLVLGSVCIDGRGGNNVIAGDAHRNVLNFSATELHNIHAIDAGAGDDLVLGSAGDDLILASEGNDTLTGEGGDDTFELSEGIASPGDAGDGFGAGEWTVVSKKGDGSEVTYDGLTTLEIRDGKIVSGQDYMELAPLMKHMLA